MSSKSWLVSAMIAESTRTRQIDHPFYVPPAELSGRSGPMLDIHKNPLLVSILNSCEMLKALDAKGELPLNHIRHARALLFLKADKV